MRALSLFFFSRSLAGLVFGVGTYSAEKPQSSGEPCSAGWKLATEPMNRFFQRRPEGHRVPPPSLSLGSAILSRTRIAASKHVERDIPAKSLNRCFYRFSFWKERNYCCRVLRHPPSPLSVSRRRLRSLAAATSYFMLFNRLASRPGDSIPGGNFSRRKLKVLSLGRLDRFVSPVT